MPKSKKQASKRRAKRAKADKSISIDIQAAASTGKLDGEFEINAYSGGLLDLNNFEHPLVVDLQGCEIMGGKGAQSPLVWEHDPGRPLGHTYFVVEASQIVGKRSRLTHDNDDVRMVKTVADRKTQVQHSVGMKLLQPATLIPAGQQITVNGKRFVGPVFVAKKTILRDGSLCTLGRDLGRAAIAASAARENSEMNDFEKWVTEVLGMDLESLSDEAKASLKATYEAAQADEVEASEDSETVSASAASGDVAVDVVRQAQQAAIDTNRRINRVNEINASFSNVASATRDPLYEQAIEGKLTTEGFELALMRQQRDTPSQSGVATINASRGISNPHAVEAALLLSNGMSQDDIAASMGSDYSNKEIETAIDQASESHMRNMRWSDAVYACYDAQGLTPPSRRFGEDVLRGAWDISASAASTVNLGAILEQAVNRTLLDAYNDSMGVANEICFVTENSDFKESSHVRITAAGTLEPVAKNEDIAHMDLSEEATTCKVQNHSKLLGLSEEDQLSDDLGAFLQLSRAFSRAGAQAVEIAVIEALTHASSSTGAGNASTFFRGAKNKNRQANMFAAATALGIGTLDSAVEMLESQTDSAGLPIQVDGNVLLVPPSLKAMAQRLYTSANIVAAGSTDVLLGESNNHMGLYRPVSSRHLGMSQFNPTSIAVPKDQWYLLARDGDVAPLLLAYLGGRGKAPRVRSFEQAQRIGVTLRPQLAFAAALHDPRAIVGNRV